MKRIYTIIIAALTLSSATAQEEWTLQKCVNHAITNSFVIAQSDIGVRDAAIATELSEQERYPSLNGNANVNWSFGRSIDPTSNSFVNTTFFSNRYGLNTNVSLYEGGRIKNSIRRNEIREDIAKEDRNTQINNLTRDVATTYFNVLLAEDRYQTVLVQLRSVENQIEQMNKLVSAGSRARFELLDLEAQKATVQQDITIAQNNIDIAILNLKNIINLPSDYDISVVKPQVDEAINTNLELATLEEVYDRALRTQPDVRSLDLQIAAAQSDIAIAKSQYYPSLSFGGSLSTNYSNQAKEADGGENVPVNANVLIDGAASVITTERFVPNFVNTPYLNQIDNNFGYGFGFSVGVPIYNRGQVKSNVERSRLQLENVRIQKEQNNIALKNNMMRLLTDARAAKRSYEASAKTLEARQVSYENAEKRYQLGAINTYEYTSIQDQVTTAKNNYDLARYDYLLKAKMLDFYQGYPLSRQ